MTETVKMVKEGNEMMKLGEIPNGWNVETMKDIIDSTQLGTGTLGNEDVSNGIPMLKMGNLNIGGFKFDKIQYIADEELEINKEFILNKGDFLFNTRNTLELVGKSATWNNQLPVSVFNSNIMRIKYKSNIDSFYMSYYFQDDEGWKKLKAIATGTTSVAAIYTKDLMKVKVKVPSINEQQEICLILNSVDEKIENTDKIIEKTKELKRGLMQRLLTKGIGHDRFKNTELGGIPEEWDFECGFINIKSGFGFKLNEYVVEGIPLIRINNVMYGKITDENLSFLPETYLEKCKDFALKIGDILLALNRPITNNHLKIGKVTNEPCILYQRVGKLEMNIKKYNPNFYFQYLQSDFFVNTLLSSLVGTDQPYIKTSEFGKIYFPVPSIDEQNKIDTILSSVDEKIEHYEFLKGRLQELKKGLMQKLLTGKIRVKI